MNPLDLILFVRESNRIEGITRLALQHELEAHVEFLERKIITVAGLQNLVSALAPHAQLRNLHGMDVRVGNHMPPGGGPKVRADLELILDNVNGRVFDPWTMHIAYETLHPFTDGNGRSGRALWAWQMLRAGNERWMTMGFLHLFYYQTLDKAGR